MAGKQNPGRALAGALAGASANVIAGERDEPNVTTTTNSNQELRTQRPEPLVRIIDRIARREDAAR